MNLNCHVPDDRVSTEMAERICMDARGISLSKISYTFGKNPFVFKKNPSKIRINPFVFKKSRTLFPMSEVPLAWMDILSTQSFLQVC